MIKKYNQFLNETLLDELKGPSEEELLDELKKMSPNDMLNVSIELNFKEGMKYALKQGADDDIYNRYLEICDWFGNYIQNLKILPFEKKQIGDDVIYTKYRRIILRIDKDNCCYYNFKLIGEPIIDNYHIYWKNAAKIMTGITKKYFNFYPTFVTFSSFDEEKWKKIENKL